MIDINKIALQIIAEAADTEVDPSKSQKKTLKTTIPEEKIKTAIKLAQGLQQKLNSLLSDVILSLEDLQKTEPPSVLESQDNFESLVLKLEKMKTKLISI